MDTGWHASRWSTQRITYLLSTAPTHEDRQKSALWAAEGSAEWTINSVRLVSVYTRKHCGAFRPIFSSQKLSPALAVH